jgi:predicted nucleic acid-binding protein
MNMTKNAQAELDSQESIHRMTRVELAEMCRLAEQFSYTFKHDSITVTDVRYAACAVVAQRLAVAA